MYYSFPCTYCHRVFYAYDSDKQHAALTLYRTIKQHLIDYDEDKKEYELDDGEQMDTDQIYTEMKPSHHAPVGGYPATKTSTVVHLEKEKIEKQETQSSHSDHHSSSFVSQLALLIFLLILLLGTISLFFIFPDMFKLELPQLAF